MNQDEVIKLIQDHIPEYLSLSAKDYLNECIKTQFPESRTPEHIYMTPKNTDYDSDEFLQGMIIDEIPFPLLENLDEGEEGVVPVVYAPGIIITPSCHNDESNHSILENSILFARINDIGEFIDALTREGVPQNKIESWLDSLKSNKISSCMYLPAYNTAFMEIRESFIQFDYTTRVPASILPKNKIVSPIIDGGARIANLQLYGFYLFIVKYSYFMFRFSEKLDRYNI
ncbi:MAG: hypothetical protein EDM75_11825 [Chlorobiota bacterium]|nr:MAG: hypothetical protein EDM75_11825 [Chlorobiota bacterium]